MVLRAEVYQLQQQLAQLRQDLEKSQAELLLAANRLRELATVPAVHADSAINLLPGLAERTNQRDPLTDMPNRALMMDRLESSIALSQRHGTRIAIIFLDLDNFKPINDSMGHAAGDTVLKLAARRIESAVRDSDAVSRHGGDEFLVLLNEVCHATDAALIAKKMLLNLTTPCLVDQQKIQITASIGIAICPDDSQDAATLIALADAAMYRSKRRGGGSYTFHDPQECASSIALSNQPKISLQALQVH